MFLWGIWTFTQIFQADFGNNHANTVCCQWTLKSSETKSCSCWIWRSFHKQNFFTTAPLKYLDIITIYVTGKLNLNVYAATTECSSHWVYNYPITHNNNMSVAVCDVHSEQYILYSYQSLMSCCRRMWECDSRVSNSAFSSHAQSHTDALTPPYTPLFVHALGEVVEIPIWGSTPASFCVSHLRELCIYLDAPWHFTPRVLISWRPRLDDHLDPGILYFFCSCTF